MKAISLWQPWASLIAHGFKRIETRSWCCPWPAGTTLAIHAAKRWTQDLADLARGNSLFAGALRAMGVTWNERRRPRLPLPVGLPFGAVVCVTELVRCVPTRDVRGLLTPTERAFGDYSDGRWAWVLGPARLLPVPVPAVGRQGIWDLSL